MKACCQLVNEELQQTRLLNAALDEENTQMKRERAKWLQLQEDHQQIKQRLSFVETKCQQLEFYNQQLTEHLHSTSSEIQTFQAFFKSIEAQLGPLKDLQTRDLSREQEESFQVKGVDFGVMGAVQKLAGQKKSSPSTPKKLKRVTPRRTPKRSSRTPSKRT